MSLRNYGSRISEYKGRIGMRKLSKEQQNTKEEHRSAIEAAYAKLAGEIGDYNSQMRQQWQELEVAYIAYKEACENAREFVAETVGEMEAYFEDRSESWQDGERGDAYHEWTQTWEEVAGTLEGVEDLEQPEEIEYVDSLHETLDDLTDEVEG
jgi:hypothetical protein